MKLLVTGGLGYIGSHTVVELIESGHEVVIVDNLCNSDISVLDKIEMLVGFKPTFYGVDINDWLAMNEIFQKHDFDGVIHFAGLKAVGESVAKPLEYYSNNISGTLTLLEVMRHFNVKRIVFSSSACVYGEPKENPITEDAECNHATNPYGRTKQFIEEILKDLVVADSEMKVTILRYFNPVGAHPSGLLGEEPNGIPNNLMPYVQQVADGRREILNIFGNDYPTPDGTCIRDFIHVVDLAKGHVKAIEKIDDKPLRIVNLGTGKGTSVLELVTAFNRVTNGKVKYRFAPRRPGDVPANYADPSKAKEELNWTANLSIDDMCKDTWNFVQRNAKIPSPENKISNKKIIVASNNNHKIGEIKAILKDYEILTLNEIGFNDDIEENGNTFEDNAKIKALSVRKYIKNTKYENYIVLADDSGLCVESLHGAPGIFSSRYSGQGSEGNRQKLLQELKGKTNRKAYFICAMIMSLPDGELIPCVGRTYGLISDKKIGDESFGYDCLFISDDLNKTFGEASEEEKNSVSHRYRALLKIKEKLDDLNRS